MQHFQNLTKNQASDEPELFSQSSPARSFRRGLARAQRSVAEREVRLSRQWLRCPHPPSACLLSISSGERRVAPRHARAAPVTPTERASEPLHCSSLVEVNCEFGNRKYDMMRIQIIWVGMQWTKTYLT